MIIDAQLQALLSRIRSKPPFVRFTEQLFLKTTAKFVQTAIQICPNPGRSDAMLFVEWMKVS